MSPLDGEGGGNRSRAGASHQYGGHSFGDPNRSGGTELPRLTSDPVCTADRRGGILIPSGPHRTPRWIINPSNGVRPVPGGPIRSTRTRSAVRNTFQRPHVYKGVGTPRRRSTPGTGTTWTTARRGSPGSPAGPTTAALLTRPVERKRPSNRRASATCSRDTSTRAGGGFASRRRGRCRAVGGRRVIPRVARRVGPGVCRAGGPTRPRE
jgi:hypothetical protein